MGTSNNWTCQRRFGFPDRVLKIKVANILENVIIILIFEREFENKTCQVVSFKNSYLRGGVTIKEHTVIADFRKKAFIIFSTKKWIRAL